MKKITMKKSTTKKHMKNKQKAGYNYDNALNSIKNNVCTNTVDNSIDNLCKTIKKDISLQDFENHIEKSSIMCESCNDYKRL